MNLRIVKYAIEKQIYPPFRESAVRFLEGSLDINTEGFALNETIATRTDGYPDIGQPEDDV